MRETPEGDRGVEHGAPRLCYPRRRGVRRSSPGGCKYAAGVEIFRLRPATRDVEDVEWQEPRRK